MSNSNFKTGFWAGVGYVVGSFLTGMITFVIVIGILYALVSWAA